MDKKRHLAPVLALLLLLFAAILAGPTAARAASVDGPFIVVDVTSGAVLEDRDALRPWYPASTTKLMTAYVTFRAIKAGDLTPKSAVTVSQNALAQPPSKMGFKVGTVLTVDNALKMMMVKSANDIAVAVAEAVAGTERRFIERMNEEAARLGMRGTRFANPHGLPNDGQVTTARDMAVLARALLTEFPEHRHYFNISAIQIGKRVLRNYNTLVDRYRGTTGMKTGYICASGFNLVASARRGEREVIAVVFGSFSASERAEQAARLLDAGFRNRRGRTNLDTVRSGSRYRDAIDMRPRICSQEARAARARAGADGEEEPQYKEMANGRIIIANSGSYTSSGLGEARPKPPIKVFTGGAVANIRPAPLPRARPVGVPAPPMADPARPRMENAAVRTTQSTVIAESGGDAENPEILPLAGSAPVLPSAFVAPVRRIDDKASLAIAPDRRLPRPRPR